MVRYKYAAVDGKTIFYREGGPANAPTILLPHGFPTSSHMFRNLIPALADRYHVVAPDLPGFGLSDSPNGKKFPYTFENLAGVIDTFTQAIGLQHFAHWTGTPFDSTRRAIRFDGVRFVEYTSDWNA